MKPLLFLTLVLGLLRPVSANDSASSGIGGRWRMLKAEHRSVQMVSERVVIDGRRLSFRTTADFVFRNHGRAQWVSMGFPDFSGGDVARGLKDPSTLENFRTWVDGRRVRARFYRVSSRAYGESLGLWTKRVWFGAGQTRRVRVRYFSGSGGGSSNGDQWVSYNFTGGNWRGKVRESVLEVRFPAEGHYAFKTDDVTFKSSDKDRPTVTRRGTNFRFRWTNWQAQKEWQLGYYDLFPDDLNRNNSVGLGEGWFVVKNTPRGLPTQNGYYGPEVFDRQGRKALLLNGHLWVRAGWVATAKWDEKRKGMELVSGVRSTFISARGATKNGTGWPLDARKPLWISDGENHLFVPARDVAQKLGLRFIVNRKSGQVRWEKSSRRGDYFRLS